MATQINITRTHGTTRTFRQNTSTLILDALAVAEVGDELAAVKISTHAHIHNSHTQETHLHTHAPDVIDTRGA